MLRLLRAHTWLAVICGAMFLTAGGVGLSNPVLSLYGQSFGVSASLVGFYITTFAVGRLIATIPAARSADRWGYRKLLILGPIVVALGTLGLASAASYPQLVAFRFVQGIGSAINLSAGFLAVADLSAPEERGSITGLFQGSMLLGLAVMPAVSGVLAASYGLRAPLYGAALLACMAGLLNWWRFPESRMEHPQVVGAQPPSPTAPARGLLTNRSFVMAALAALIILVARSGSRTTILPLLGHELLGLDTRQVGLAFSLIAGVNFLVAPAGGVLADGLGRKPAVILGLGIYSVGLGLIGFATSFAWIALGGVLIGIGTGLGEPSIFASITDMAPKGRYGAIYGLFLTLRDLGLLAGPIVSGWLADYVGLRFPIVLNAAAMFGIALLFGLIAKETQPVAVARRLPNSIP